jgi:hypothetical protein
LEILPSAFILPLDMRFVRSFNPHVLYLFVRLLSLFTSNLIFYLHPTEFLEIEKMEIPVGHKKNFFNNCGQQNFDKLITFIKIVNDLKFKSEYMFDVYRQTIEDNKTIHS